MDKELPAGFTLVELMVTISLVAILFGIGIASYIEFNRRQLVFMSARKIVQDLRLTQSLASNNQKPVGCNTTLEGYTFRISGTTYFIEVNCSGQLPVSTKDDSVPSNLTLSGFTQVKFKILNQTRECNTSPCQLVVRGFNTISKTITVDAGGVIKIVGE